MKELGTRIKQLRDKKRWSQFILAKKSKISTTTVQRIETGSGKVAYSTLFKIADALKVSVDYLKTGAESKAPELKEIEETFHRLIEKMRKKDSVQVLIKNGKAEADELKIFLNSEDVPKDVRETVLEMIRSLKMKYTNRSNDSDSTK